jgi:hypothetical protein
MKLSSITSITTVLEVGFFIEGIIYKTPHGMTKNCQYYA